ncbi:MAG: alpha/beta fold hydrolase [Flavobacteriaceae bacterium]
MQLDNIYGFLVAAIFFFMMNSCSSLNNVKVEDSYGKRIAYVQEGVGSPAIILESGFDTGMESWAGIIDSLAQYSKVYTYDRPGYGRSNKKDAPHTIEGVAKQLYANLVARNIAPPYVLVGHAGGALFVNMFARLYPEITVGVLMVEPTHPDYYNYLRENEALIYDLLFDYIGNGQRRYEFDLIKNASEEFSNAPEFPDIPLTILMAGRHTSLESEELKAKTLEFHEELKNMSSKGKRYLVEDSRMSIHRSDPQLVIDYVVQLLK